ncbi:MAG: hypothetical protein LBK65_09175 [Tannerellaceae bacterium]|jgi:uncharacterized protein YndB with AHSA1/START domain|nr:hypothetical protein [Tannerellaceae bacterium]
MKEKEKFHIEYILDTVSRRSLWNHLTTPPGLSSWFAEQVKIDNNRYIFKWSKEEQEAEVLSMKTETSIRYRWTDDDPEYYFEFIIHTIELTGSIALEITDFAEPEEKQDAIELWDTQIEELKRTLGI